MLNFGRILIKFIKFTKKSFVKFYEYSQSNSRKILIKVKDNFEEI